MNRRSRPRALLLGMVYSEEMEPKRGQEYRDRVRCEALQNIGYNVYTLDNKHEDEVLSNGRHCTANFADARRMLRSMQNRWMDYSFNEVILDYFFCPVRVFSAFLVYYTTLISNNTTLYYILHYQTYRILFMLGWMG